MADSIKHNTALADRDAALRERDAALARVDFLLDTRSWFVTRPLRFIARIMRYGLLEAFSGSANVAFRAQGVTFPGGPAQQSARHCAPEVEPHRQLDILCFANIEWAARFQRPQQLMSQFAREGHRVFYIVPSRIPPEERPYSLTRVAHNIFEVALLHDAQDLYYEKVVTPENTQAYRHALDLLTEDFQIQDALSLVHIPYWSPLAIELRADRGWPIQYDCMDDWDGFPNIGAELVTEEKTLVAQADLVTVSAALLHRKWSDHCKRCVLVRNAVDFEFFQQHCMPNDLLPALAGPVIGYYGALAQWLDFPLLAALADKRPDWNFVLVGDVFVDDLAGLEGKPNVLLSGRKPYTQMPLYLHRFDVCLIPFLLNNVTHAVDPVKLYEYLSAGKPVVSAPLEELSLYKDILYFATDVDEYLVQIERALTETAQDRIQHRVETARSNDWKDRFETSRQAINALDVRASIIVVTYNNLDLTRECIDSIVRNTTSVRYQLIIVDNGSEDGTPAYLEQLSRDNPDVDIILNADNRGFSAANNQGLRRARGEILLLLNNDTVVPEDWLTPLIKHLQDPGIGLIGPVTNAVGNEAKIAVPYTSIQQMHAFASRYTAEHKGQVFDIPMLAMFCVAMRRDVLRQVGYLDEAFGIGLFEDDDYSRRVQAAGYRTVCAEDAFVHHYGQASFKKLIVSGEYQALWDTNQAYFESKWQTWTPHTHRASAAPGKNETELPGDAQPHAEPAVNDRRALGETFRQFFRSRLGLTRTPSADDPSSSKPLPEPASQLPELPDYIIWGVIDWHFRHQRPQQLAQALATQQRRVFYVSCTLVDETNSGFHVQPLDSEGRLFQINLFAKGAPAIYHAGPSPALQKQLRRSIGQVLQWADCQHVISLVNHPFWHEIAQAVPNSRMVYDCIDHHEGFGDNSTDVLALEHKLLSDAELTIFTSTWLEQHRAAEARRTALIRNAADYEHFATPPDHCYRDSQGRRIIGYYGAIAEWFDTDLLLAVARHFSDCCILLIGADTVHAQARLKHQTNITWIGEVPYSQLPEYLHSFDVCLLPFRVLPLTLATNPVKIYEYLSAGKPVVAVDLPEMGQFGQRIKVADTTEGYLAAIAQVLDPLPDEHLERQAFAREQTWTHRSEALILQAETDQFDAPVSVIIVTYNNLPLTRACLTSLDDFNDYANLEIIVVDNASSDDTPTFLQDWATRKSQRKIILNHDNRGFAAANNQGLALAKGDYLVLLNNDTRVTPGWLRTLTNHLKRDRRIGLIGPVTNNIGNEAKVDIAYDSPDEMPDAAARLTRSHCGDTLNLRTLAFFCVMLPRSTYEQVGPLDEVFGLGFFEDDDYCRRVEQAGLKLVCAEDVFIHHQLSASFDRMKHEQRQELFNRNKKIYEAKWGEWIPHQYRA